jgi:outer membrane protein assembly factor BamE
VKYLIKAFLVSTSLLAFTLSGCSSPIKSGFPGIPGVYKIDVQQGNIVTQDMIDQLRPGMTKQQVQFVMGTPLILDTFAPDRWDYVYSIQPGGKKRKQKSVSLFFENDQLTHFVGDFIPTQAIKK